MTLFTPEQYEAAMGRAGLVAVETVPSPSPARDRYIGKIALR